MREVLKEHKENFADSVRMFALTSCSAIIGWGLPVAFIEGQLNASAVLGYSRPLIQLAGALTVLKFCSTKAQTRK